MKFGLILIAAQVAAATTGTPATEQPATVATQSASLSLHLICGGTGERKVRHGAGGVAFGGGHTTTFVGGTSSLSQFGEQMDIDIQGDSAKVRVPRRFLPKFHGGDGGWFEVKELRPC